jgi:arylsulfatase
MAKMFDEQAELYGVKPYMNMIDAVASNQGRLRADGIARHGKWYYPAPVGSVPIALTPPVLYVGYDMTATVDLYSADATGPIFAYGGQMGGMALYLNHGKPTFIVNGLNGQGITVASEEALGTGVTKLALEFQAGAQQIDGTKQYKVDIRTGDGRLLAGKSFAFAMPFFFGIGEMFGVGKDQGSPVLAGYQEGTLFPGKVSDVTFDVTKKTVPANSP